MKSNYLVLFSLVIIFFTACNKDDDSTANDSEFVVAFKNPSTAFAETDNEKEIDLVFSNEAPQDGILVITYTETNLSYGEDYSTTPSAQSEIIEIPIAMGTLQTSFSLERLNSNPAQNEPDKSIEFSITEVNIPNGFTQGNTTNLVSFSDTASLGGSISPNLGGPNEGNQVYLDLSTQQETVVSRDKWDLAFYNGDQFRVKLNSSLFMMAAPLETTNIDVVTEADVASLQSQMAFLVQGSNEFVDAPSGNLNETVIEEISINLEENKVYLIKMGNEIGIDTPETGSVAVAGADRGWKKIRIVQESGAYKLLYADLDATTHQQITIAKDNSHDFNYFSMVNENVVDVAPTKGKWDLNFTVFTEVLDLPEGGESAYGFSDYVATNTLSNTRAYQVMTEDIAYQDFTSSNIDNSLYEIDQRVIGANWRDVFNGLFNERFYIIQDTDGNTYKLKFTSMVNENGVRGYPKFEYQILN